MQAQLKDPKKVKAILKERKWSSFVLSMMAKVSMRSIRLMMHRDLISAADAKQLADVLGIDLEKSFIFTENGEIIRLQDYKEMEMRWK